MKQIILVRHGKSSWDYNVADRDRPLKERGITDAAMVAKQLALTGLQIAACFSSPANRALHTATIFLRTLNIPFSKLVVTEELYDFSGESALKFIKNLDDGLNTVLVFGHNHAFTALVNLLGDQYIENLPTAGMAILTIDVPQWQQIAKGQTQQTTFPKELR